MIIDTHCHLGYSPEFRFPDVSVETVLRVMDLLHVEKAICSHLALLCGYLDFGFNESIRAYEKSTGRILLYTVFNPNVEGGLRFVRKCVEREEFVGIKIHPSFHQCYADDEKYRPVWEFAAERRLPILTHSWIVSDYNPAQKFSFPSRFEKYITAYPAATVILAHAGGRVHGHRVAAELAKKYENVYLDISGDGYSLGLIEYLIEHAGAEKVLFGSDLTWIDPRTHLGRVLQADADPADKEKILRLNAIKVFAL